MGIVIDESLLRGLRRYDDPQAGISEEFLEPGLDSGPTLAILTRPLGPRHPIGWVICPALTSELGNLRRLEALTARRLAACGFTVMRLRDGSPANGSRTEANLSTRLDQAASAVEVFRAEADVEVVGLIGSLLGGAVAAMACDRLELPLMVLWEPIVRGAPQMKEMLRIQALSQLSGTVPREGEGRPGQALAELSELGWTTVRGGRLPRELYEEIVALDLTDEIRTFHGRSLLVGVSSSGDARPDLRRLFEHLERLGGEPTLEVIQDPLVAPFGEHFYRDEGLVRVDTRLELDQKLAAATSDWASRRLVTEDPAG